MRVCVTSSLVSSDTRAASAGWNEPLMRKYFGWGASSDMPSTYIHLSQKDIEDRVRAEARLDPLGAAMRESPTDALATAPAVAIPHAVAETMKAHSPLRPWLAVVVGPAHQNPHEQG